MVLSVMGQGQTSLKQSKPVYRVKWLGCEADHTPPSSAKVTKECSYTPLHHMSEWCEQGNLTFAF